MMDLDFCRAPLTIYKMYWNFNGNTSIWEPLPKPYTLSPKNINTPPPLPSSCELKIWKCQNLPERLLSKEMEESALHHYSIQFSPGVCPGWPQEGELQGETVQRPSRMWLWHFCEMNFSKVEILSIVNLRRQPTTWKLECHPKMMNSGVSTSQYNYLQ